MIVVGLIVFLVPWDFVESHVLLSLWITPPLLLRRDPSRGERKTGQGVLGLPVGQLKMEGLLLQVSHSSLVMTVLDSQQFRN